MAEFWRYQDRLAAGQLLPKRPKNEVPLHGSAGYGRGDLRFDERDARAFGYGLDYGKAGVDYGKAGVDYGKAGVDYGKAGVDYGKAGVDYGNAGAAFGSVGFTGAEITGLADGTLLGAGVNGSLRGPTLRFSALEDPQISGANPGLLKGASAGVNGARSDITPAQEFSEAVAGLLSHPLASRGLFVEGLPLDCSRREAAHIFRRFHGYKDIRLNQKGKGSKKSGVLLCFVDFEDSFSAARALEALRGYKFDEDDPTAEPLQVQFSTRGPRNGTKPARRKRKR